jgi:hypothetical protein
MSDNLGSYKGIFALPNEVSHALSHSAHNSQSTHGLIIPTTRSYSTSSISRPHVNCFPLLQRAAISTRSSCA